ncbi:MAG: RHS repeat-associated core domain-containing protein [Bacteroidales bacterium]|nr:RHS repeat-associated core domain-containing protein [Bacteroidales bacterium]
MTAIEQYGEYEERDMKYDANGNLLAMKRIMSWEDSTHLSFGYSGNRMETVSADDSLWRYSYDSDGDMVSDGHRGLELSYNFLNLPSRIRIKDSGSLVYSYLSDGTMLSVTDSLSGRGLKFRGSFIYTVSPEGEESVESVSYGEGRLYACTRTPSADDAGQGSIDAGPDFIDTWFVRDYLGSVRMVIDISRHEAQSLPEVILSRSDYLPFGLPFSPARYSVASAMQRSDASDALQETSSGASGIPQSALTRWQYNGKPEQVTGIAETGLLDYGARFYDPYIARWTSVDPMADKRHSSGCYVFCSDDPVNRIDQDGDVDWRLVGKGALATVSGVGSVAGGVGMAATAALAPAGMFFMVEGFASVGLGVTLMITGAVTDPSESTDKLLENMPTSMTSTVSKSADIVAGNENGEIERATSFVMLAVGVKGVVDILKNPPVTLSDKFSILGTISDSGIFYWDFVGYEEEDDDDDNDDK